MTVPYLTETRLHAVRRLDAAECELLGFAGPLVLSRRHYRFLFGPWRPVDAYVVTHRERGDLLVCTRQELESLGIDL